MRRKPLNTNATPRAMSSEGVIEKHDTTPSARSLSQIVRSAETVARRSCSVFGAVSSSRNALPKHDCDSVDGTNPVAVLDQGSDGNFYGTTYAGGNRGSWGTVFEVTPSGTLTTLHSFGLTDGAQPYGAVAQATSGIFYGTATNGGANNDGTLFSLAVGLGPFVETQPASGKVGAKVIILGTDLTGTTSVTFHGTPAIFTVVSKSEIRTSVPAGATTGKVTMKTPSSTSPHGNWRWRIPWMM